LIKVGLTGVIASGKSTVSGMFAELGAVIIDADVLARQVIEPGGPAYDEAVREFGEGILNEDKSVNRRALADKVFGDPGKRELLESIIHPAVFAEEERLTKEAEAVNPNAVVIFDAALLIESGAYKRMDKVIVVSCDKDERYGRFMARGGDPEELERREAAQMPLDRKLEYADYFVDNSGTREETARQVAGIYGELRHMV